MHKGLDSFIYFKKIIFWSNLESRGIFVPQSGIESIPPTLEGWSRNYWSTMEVPKSPFFMVSMQAEKSVANTDYFFWKRKIKPNRYY